MPKTSREQNHGVQWGDLDIEPRQLLLQRSIANGRVSNVRTEYSHDHVPISRFIVGGAARVEREVPADGRRMDVPESAFEQALLFDRDPEAPSSHFRMLRCSMSNMRRGDWRTVRAGELTANGKRVVIHELRKTAAGKFAEIGWHTFRHTYCSWLDETGAPMKVQQELMRHASIQTTIKVYGQAMPESKRKANGKVVTMVLKPLRASA